MPPVRDQGERGTCLAFAVTAAHEVARAHVMGIVEDLAEETLYWGCKQIDGDTDDGTYLDSTVVALRQWGQPTESHWPYDGARKMDASYIPPAQALDPSQCHAADVRPVNLVIVDV